MTKTSVEGGRGHEKLMESWFAGYLALLAQDLIGQGLKRKTEPRMDG
jgi:hypothetical protein